MERHGGSGIERVDSRGFGGGEYDLVPEDEPSVPNKCCRDTELCGCSALTAGYYGTSQIGFNRDLVWDLRSDVL